MINDAGTKSKISAGRKYLISIFRKNGDVPKHSTTYIERKNIRDIKLIFKFLIFKRETMPIKPNKINVVL